MSLAHFPNGKWEFDAAVTAVFDEMARRSIPLYDDFHRFAVELARPVVGAGSTVLDVGCSTGNLVEKLVAELGVDVHGVDESEAMVKACRDRFAGESRIAVVGGDVTSSTGFSGVDALRGSSRYDAAFAVLTLMFLAPTARMNVLAKLHSRMNAGGVLVVVEKTYAREPRNERVFTDVYHEFKARAGYSRAEIERKADSLSNVLRPWTVDATVSVVEEAGFRDAEVFAKWGPFAGIVARR